MKRLRSVKQTAFRLSLIAAIFSCGTSTSTPLDLDPFLGSYTPAEILVVDNGDTTDYVALGARFSLVLELPDVATVDVHLPGADVGGGDITSQFVTTWRSDLFVLSGGGTATIVQLRRGNQAGPPFVYDLAWLVDGARITTERQQCGFQFSDTPIPLCLFRIILNRQ